MILSLNFQSRDCLSLLLFFLSFLINFSNFQTCDEERKEKKKRKEKSRKNSWNGKFLKTEFRRMEFPARIYIFTIYTIIHILEAKSLALGG